ncbi:hypothetical protein EYZ11_004747 [Aspergillus tanneri]|uniref:Uncharacterized protein n=1 Tax=Aspergillus tanneri TaxID=1220188 RepID=A0A4V3UPN6_9EURO|nr:hypothetical protein EYZ11_004747 [Aspergillus tanneri]
MGSRECEPEALGSELILFPACSGHHAIVTPKQLTLECDYYSGGLQARARGRLNQGKVCLARQTLHIARSPTNGPNKSLRCD